MKKLIALSILILAGVLSGNAQTDCPVDKVCLTRESALKALADADAVVALRSEIKAREAAYIAQKELLNEIRVEFARASGELTALKQQQVRDAALIELFSKNMKKKRIALVTLF